MIDNIKCVKKQVTNLSVYYQLSLASFHHVPKIIKIEGEYVFYEYIAGATLSDCLDDKRFNENERIALGLQLIDGLKTINENHIIHKDIKPDNIIYGNDNMIYFIDFGASRVFDGSKNRDTVLLGTQNYASPEHYGYQETTFKSDMYSLGRVLDDLVLPIQFKAVIERCLKISPEDRYDSYELLINEYKTIAKQALTYHDNSIIIAGKTEETTKETNNNTTNYLAFLSFQKYGYCFDKSLAQMVFTIVVLVFYLIIGIYMFISDATYSTTTLLFWGVILFCTVVTCYFVDIIRIVIKKLIDPNIPLSKYLLRATINIAIVFFSVIGLGLLDNIIIALLR